MSHCYYVQVGWCVFANAHASSGLTCLTHVGDNSLRCLPAPTVTSGQELKETPKRNVYDLTEVAVSRNIRCCQLMHAVCNQCAQRPLAHAHCTLLVYVIYFAQVKSLVSSTMVCSWRDAYSRQCVCMHVCLCNVTEKHHQG